VQLLLAWVLLSLLLSAVVPEIAWQGKVFYSADSEAPIHFTVAGERALEDAYPVWNPYLYLGMPSFGSLMFMPYVYPVTVVLQALGHLPGTPPLGWMLFYFVLAGFGVFVLLRSLHAGFWPALLGGAAFMLTPHVMSMGVFGHGGKLGAVAFLPFLLWAALALSRARWRLVWIGVLALFVGLQMLRGHPQIAYYGLLLIGLLAVVEIVGQLRHRVGRRRVLVYAGSVGLALVLGLALGAVLLLPVRAYAPESIRGSEVGGGASYDYATKWSLSPGEVVTFLMPSAAGFGEVTYTGGMPWTNFPNYLGQAVGLFAVAAFILLRGRLLVYLALVLVLSLLISFGSEMPLLYRLLYDYLPHFSKFRVPAMILVLFQLAAAVTAGLGMAAVFGVLPRGLQWRHAMTQRFATRLFVGCVIAAGVLLLAAWPWAASLADQVLSSRRIPPDLTPRFAAVARSMLTGDAVRIALILAASGGAVALAWRRRLTSDLAGGIVLLLLLVDLAAVDRRMVRPDHTWPNLDSRITEPSFLEVRDSEMADFLLQQHPEQVAPIRVLPVGSWFTSNHWMSHGISSVGGYHPAKLSRIQGLLMDESLLYTGKCARLLGVQYVVSQEPINTAARRVWEGAEGVVYEIPDPTPRAWVTGRWRQAPGPGSECLGFLFGPEVDPDREVVLEQPPQNAPDSLAVGRARITEFHDNRVVVDVESSAAALLVLREAYHSGWRATVDDQPAPVLAADCLMRAVEIPAGTSRVEFHFEHPGLATGLWLTLGALGMVIVLIAVGWWAGRRAPDASAAGSGRVA
jgi:hypothetical protein